MLEEFGAKWVVQKARTAKYEENFEVRGALHEVLKGRGIKKLYLHQAEAIRKVREGKNIVLMAPTASGKTECYMVPVVEAALQGKCSLLLFPTKALSRDQWARIREFSMLGVRSEVYDGDTPASKRARIRADMPHVIITNVDMLHFMLCHSRLWEDFFSRLKYVVVDEIHAYSGNLGSHVANLMWRMKRVLKNSKRAAKKKDRAQKSLLEVGAGVELDERGAGLKKIKKGGLMGNEVRFIASSATVFNAHEFAQKICGEEFHVVKGESAPTGKVMHAVLEEGEGGIVGISLKAAKQIGKKTIIFANSHNVAERLALVAQNMDMELAVYRSGLPAEERRDIEAGFRSGRIRTMAATSALELGMDVGDADCAIMCGFAGTVTRMRQRIGRVGRKGQDAYAILVAKNNALDAYYAQNPKNYLEGEAESCYANKDNEYIRRVHLLCAARDFALEQEEIGKNDLKICKKLVEEGLLREFSGVFMPTREGTIFARKMSLRGAGRSIRIIDAKGGKVLGEREFSIAIGELYAGAIYLLGGKRYSSLGIDAQEGVAKVRRIEDDSQYYTQALRRKGAEVLKMHGEGKMGDVKLHMGEVHITNEVYGYMLKDSYTGEVIYKKEIDEPLVHEFDTMAFWADWDEFACGGEFADALHALEHVSISMMPAISGSDPSEIGGISYPSGRIFYYEGSEGGSGLAQIIIPRYAQVVKMSLERLRKCGCKEGCPKCIFSPQCGNSNMHLDKDGAARLAQKAIEKILN